MPYVFYDKPCVFFRYAEKTSRSGRFVAGRGEIAAWNAVCFLRMSKRFYGKAGMLPPGAELIRQRNA